MEQADSAAKALEAVAHIPSKLYDCLEKTVKDTEVVLRESGSALPPYLVVSHVWGETVNTSIPGVPWNVPISEGKFETILSYCAREGIRWMWIDCICLRHDDNSDAAHEKGLVVGQMSRYFKNASDFLCVPYGDWREFADAVGRQSPFRDVVGHYELPPRFAEKLWDNIGHLDRLLANGWLHRAWTYQELLLAKNIHLPDGTIFDVDLIGRIVTWYYTILRKGILKKPDGGREYDYIHPDKEMVISKGWWVPVASWDTKLKYLESGSLDLMTAANITRNKQCSYPVDKLYGLYGVIDERDRVVVEYDRTLTEEERKGTVSLARKWKETIIKIITTGRVWPLLMDAIDPSDSNKGELWIPRITAPELCYGGFHPEVASSLNLLGVEASMEGLQISTRNVGIVTGYSASFGDGGGEINRIICCAWIMGANGFDIGPLREEMVRGLERSDVEKGGSPEESKHALIDAISADTLQQCFNVVEKDNLRKKLLYGIGGWNRRVICLRVKRSSQILVFLAWIHSTHTPKRQKCYVMDVTSVGVADYWIIVNEEEDGTYTKIGTVKSWPLETSADFLRLKLN